MKPNVFIYAPDTPEDFFSRSVAYLTTLFPDIGQRLVQRIAELAGEPAEYFGHFIRCEFVGSEFQQDHRTSKPDLKVVCSKRTLFFENKLESPLRFSQMQEHADLCRKDGSSLVFVSNIYHDDPQLLSLKECGYIHPTGRSHYVWIDMLPVFAVGERPDDHLATQLLRDFGAALKHNGMLGRTVAGASGSLYTPGSEALHAALSQLWDRMCAAGYKLAKKHQRESTIRAYPVRYQQYPLLNPRFLPTADWIHEAWDFECLVLTTLSRGVAVEEGVTLDRKLSQFDSTAECAFVPVPFNPDDGYHYHGHFLMPLHFAGDESTGDLDLSPLQQPLNEVLTFLQRVTR